MRINDIVSEFKYNGNEDVPIVGVGLYRPMKNVDYEIEHFKSNDKYIMLWTGNNDHEISFWNYDNNYYYCDLLLTVNTLENEDEFKPLQIEIPSLYYKHNKFANIPEIYDFKSNLNYLYKLSSMYNSTNLSRKIILSTIENDLDYYLNPNFSKISNFYENFSTAQCVSAPQGVEFSNNLYQNTPYIISAGNDMTIRYWDMEKEKKKNNLRGAKITDEFGDKKSYIINAHNNISYSKFTKCSFNGTYIIQSNEAYDSKKKKKHMEGLSEYQYFNGVAFHALAQNEFDVVSYEDTT